MALLKKLIDRQAAMVARLCSFSGLEESLVLNIVQYGKKICEPGTHEITDNMFMSQMMTRFEITNTIMVHQMFHVLLRLRKSANKESQIRTRCITLEEYCSVICIFLTENMELKAEWVFNVYDANGDESLNKMELYFFLRSCVLDSEDMETEDAIKDLIEIVMNVFDLDQSGSIDLPEFKALVKKNVLYIDLLGQCTPNECVVKRFLHKIKNKSPTEISALFEKDLNMVIGLGQLLPKITYESSLYPIRLDLP